MAVGVFDAAGEDKEIVVTLRLPKRRKSRFTGGRSRGLGQTVAEDRIGGPDTAHVFDLAVLVLLPLPHRRGTDSFGLGPSFHRLIRLRSASWTFRPLSPRVTVTDAQPQSAGKTPLDRPFEPLTS